MPLPWTFGGREQELGHALRILGSRDPAGVLVAGPMGVGRSRFLDELATRAEISTGLDVARVPAARPGPDVLREVRSLSPSGPRLVVIDDAHLLDDASVELVHRLVTDGDDRVVLSVCTDLRSPETLIGLWSAGHLEWLDLAPLDRVAVGDLVAAAIPGDVPPSLVDQLWDLSLGHPLYLRALVEVTVDADLPLSGAHGGLGAATLARSPRLAELVRSRTSGLDRAAADALELLAMAGDLPEPVAHDAMDLSARRALELRGVVDHIEADGTTAVRVCHPLVAAVVAAGTGPAARRAHARRLADAWARHEVPRARLEVARWTLDAGAPLGASEAVEAAREALQSFDFPLAERLARAGLAAGGPSPDGHLLLAEVLRDQARASEALEQLDLAAAAARDDEAHARIAIARAETRSLLMGDLTGALGVLQAAAAEITQPVAAQRVAVERAFLGAFAGDFRQVVEVAPAAVHPSTDPETELNVILVTTFAEALSLQLDGVEERIARGLELAHRVGPPFAAHQLHVSQVLAMLGQGEVGAAADLAVAGLAEARERGEPTGFWAICTAFAGCFTGDLDAAADAGLEAEASLREIDPFGVGGLAGSLGALAALQAGRAENAAEMLARSGPPVGADERAQAVIAERVAAWQALQAGSPEQAAALAADAGRASVRSTHCLWGSAALHDAVRLGFPDLVVDDLRALATAVGAPLAVLFLAHADALSRAAVPALDSVGERFGRAGCRLFAAEAEAQAAACAAAAGDHLGAVRRATRARMRWATCTGTEPVALQRAPAGLSPRQQDVARLASLGLTSREIADELVVSVRTVDNHLRQCYRMLGVTGREALADVLVGAVE